MDVLNRVLEHSLRHGLGSVYDQAYYAAVGLCADSPDVARMHLSLALPACDERAKSLVRDALQLLEGVDDREIVTDGGEPEEDGLTEDDVRRLQGLLEENRRHGNGGGC